MMDYFEAGQYGFFIWAGFSVVVFGLLALGVSSKMKFKQLTAEFDRLKAVRGDRRQRAGTNPKREEDNDS